MKMSLAIEKEEGRELSIQCSVQGCSAAETKERLTDLLNSVEGLLARDVQEEPATVAIRRGVCF